MSAHPAEFDEDRAREVCAQRFQHFDGYRSTAKQDDLKTVFVSGAAWGFACGRTVSAEQVEAAAMAINAEHEHFNPVWSELVKSRDIANRHRVKRDRRYARTAFRAAGFRVEGDPS